MKDKAGFENVVADHLFRHIVKSQEAPINDAFPDEHLMVVSMEQAPLFVNLANYLPSGILPHGLSSH